MRRSISIFAGVLLTGFLLFVISCSKEEIKSKKQNQPAQTQYEQQVIRAIKTFKEKVAYYRENPGYKSGETVSADSVLWYLESTMNYSNAIPNEYYKAFEIDTAFLIVQKNPDGTVSLDELIQKYSDLETAVTNQYNNSTFEEKGLAVVDLKEITQDDSEIVFLAEAVTGEKGIPPDPQLGGPFEAGDNWWYGEEAGKCEENGAEGSDAAEQLQNEIPNEIPDPNGNYFFINITEYIVEGGDPILRRTDWNDPEDNHLDYLLYYANSDIGLSADTSCVEWPEMNLYYNYLKFLIFSYLPDNVPELNGKSIVEVLDIDGYSVIDEYNVIHQKHRLTAKFGVKVGY